VIDSVKDSGGAVNLTPWDIHASLRQVSEIEAKFSKGFLRCRPEKWFPGFAAHWLPLAHSLGLELKILEVKPLMNYPVGLEVGYAASVDDEPLAIFMESEAAADLFQMLIPGSGEKSRGVLMEYLARRLLGSLALSWSGPESSVVQFDSEMKPDEVRFLGSVKIIVSISGKNFPVWISAGKILLEKLDGLWRRQLQSAVKADDNQSELHLEVARLAIPPSKLSDYLQSNTMVDLEVPVSDRVVLLKNGSSWLSARLCNVEGKLAFEISGEQVQSPILPEGTTCLSVELARIKLTNNQLSELSQNGAIWNTGIELDTQGH